MAAATCPGVFAANCMALIVHDQCLMSSALFKCRFNAARGYRTVCAVTFCKKNGEVEKFAVETYGFGWDCDMLQRVPHYLAACHVGRCYSG